MTPEQDKILTQDYPFVHEAIHVLIDLVREHDAKLEGTPSELDQLREQVARLAKERDEAREQGRQEAREGIVALLEGQSLVAFDLSQKKTASLSCRALHYADGTVLQEAAAIARNWKPEGGAK